MNVSTERGATPEGRRSFSPRRGLPGGRAVVGALLVTIATVGTFAYATTDEPEPATSYLVVTRDLTAGEEMTRDDTEPIAMDLAPTVAESAATSRAAVDGATVLTDIRAGTVLDVRDLASAPTVGDRAVPGVHELTIPVPSDRAPRSLSRGDRITLLAYGDTEDVLVTAIEDALVLDYGAAADGIGARGEGRLTLAVDDADAVADVTRWSYRDLTVVRTTHATGDTYPSHVGVPSSPSDGAVAP